MPTTEPDLRVVARSAAFVDWHRGALPWRDAVRSGDIATTGPRPLVRAFPEWNTRTPILT